MAKGLFTQCVCVLLRRPVSVAVVKGALSAFDVEEMSDALESSAFMGPSLLLPFRSDVNGYCVVDAVDFPWPDEMGDAKKNPLMFGAWATGQFGPNTFPGSLERAGRQCWGWDPGKTIAKQHSAFVRIRSSYTLGGSGNTRLLPADYDPVQELGFVSKVALALLSLPGALCYFNPAGEILASREAVHESLKHSESACLPPLEIWANVRFFALESDWSLMDIIGNQQLDVIDAEAWLPPGQSYEPVEVMVFLRDVTLEMLTKKATIKDTDTRDGPQGVRWRAKCFKKAFAEPQRAAVSWSPLDGSRPPTQLTKR